MADEDNNENNAPVWLGITQTIGENKWLIGRGVLPCTIMVIGHHPDADDAAHNAHFSGHSGRELESMAITHGVSLASSYMTNVIKFLPKGKKPSASELKMCAPLLAEEIQRAKPQLILCLGGEALKAVLGKDYKISTYRGVLIDHPNMPGVKVLPTFSPAYAQYNAAAGDDYNRDWKTLANWANGKQAQLDPSEWTVTSDPKALDAFAADLLKDGQVLLTVDCEWQGKHWMDSKGYIRTVQLGYAEDKAFVLELYDEQQQPLCDLNVMFKSLKQLLEHPHVMLVGHNAIADGEWLLTYGIDIRLNTVFDTMLAEHTLDSAAVYNLTALTEKYTQMGKYDVELNAWVAANAAATEHGYGAIPRDILIPYGAKDAIATYRICLRQQPLLYERGYLKARGDYPSLFASALNAQRALYEIQGYGMRIDRQRLTDLTVAYQTKLTELETKMKAIAVTAGLEDFNFRSSAQVRKLLFEVLGLTPIKATAAFDDMPWERVQQQANQGDVAASTDKRTLDILQDKHPAAKLLRDLRKVDHVCKTWLIHPDDYNENVYDETTSGGGILSKIWPDDRVHARFSQLMETGRFSSSKPNMQNFPKKAEGDIDRIFGKNADGKSLKPPDLRTMFVPDPGWVFVEADWKQAELFVLAALSGDQTMLDALRTPGKDLHDLTAITAFRLQVYDEHGNHVPEQVWLDMAASDPNWDSDNSAFKKFQKSLVYVDQRGNRMTRKQFKETIRVSAKNVNFGVPYGRGALDLAVQVKAETGTDVSIDELKAQMEQLLVAWKTNTYPAAWRYMQQCAASVETQGYVENPWGRRRIFPRTTDGSQLAAMKREAQNFPKLTGLGK